VGREKKKAKFNFPTKKTNPKKKDIAHIVGGRKKKKERTKKFSFLQKGNPLWEEKGEEALLGKGGPKYLRNCEGTVHQGRKRTRMQEKEKNIRSLDLKPQGPEEKLPWGARTTLGKKKIST